MYVSKGAEKCGTKYGVCEEGVNGVPYVWIKPTGRSTGGASTRHKIVSYVTLRRFYSDTLDTPLQEVVNDFF